MTQPILFVSHGGGPMPLLGDPGHVHLVDAYASIRDRISALPRKPDAMLYISAHWEEDIATVTSAAQPSLYYDYYGFPEESYSIQYPAAGAPQVADEVRRLLQQAGIAQAANAERGLDHGVFVPGKLLVPGAEIPCLQVSLLKSLDAEAHLELGKALAALREQNVMLVGSGFSFHNMRAFFEKDNAEGDRLNQDFEDWLSETVKECSNEERWQRLLSWEQAPGARYCHPREEHLLPLLVCATAANDVVSDAWHFEVLNKQASCYWWD